MLIKNRRTLRLNANRCNWQGLAGFILACAILASGSAFGGRISDIRGTKHNLSAVADATSTPSGGIVPTRTFKSTTETQVCVFCHTPHGATLGVTALWNRKLSNATYLPYSSSSLDAEYILGRQLDQPGGSSKLCLSCHDGTLAIGSVNVLNGVGGAEGSQTIAMPDVASGVMASGSGTTTGYTRNLGVNLSNDHPISVNYTAALFARDGELRGVDVDQKDTTTSGAIIGVRSSGYSPKAPLERAGVGDGQIQCATCHDPHLRETDTTKGNQKFLILNRFQEETATPIYSNVTDINCVACHDKNQGNIGVWAYSAHANKQVATQTYTDMAANQREFPTVAGDGASSNLPVWKAACLNCHDTHTVQGSRRLVREGTDSTATPKAGGASAIEETCYQCHSSIASNPNNALTQPTNMPDIKAAFALARHQPITLSDQENIAAEAHDIGGNFNDGTTENNCSYPLGTNSCGADFMESRAKLGVGNLANRHAECTDCHNPHRVVKFNSFLGYNGLGSLSGLPDSTGTHKHTDITGYIHTNIASGALRGTFGVEPTYTSYSFNDLPLGYEVKRGDPGSSTSTSTSAAYVTREYQVCLKCHSDYGYGDVGNIAEATATPDRPPLGGTGLTSQGLEGGKGMHYYTNQAKEFQAPLAHKGEVTTSDSGAGAGYSTNNHRSWHPVMDDTGRNVTTRGVTATQVFTLPWSNAGAVGTQTMYCDDCHGSEVTSTTSVIPDTGKAWGSHGSSRDFILKGYWSSSTGSGQTNGLCFKCHDYNSYATGTGSRTGFWTTDNGGADGHQLHYAKTGNKTRCVWCHVAVPHGWKNKGLLVNLNDVGPEAGLAAGTEVRNNTTAAYSAAPYYLNAVLKVINFKASGTWTANDCGSAGGSGNGLFGKSWMGTISGVPTTENCITPP